MNQTLKRMVFSGLSFWVVLAAIGLYCLFPLDKKLKRGIDLAGGTYITLSVETDKAIEALLLDKLDAALDILKSAGIAKPMRQDVGIDKITLLFHSPEEAQQATDILSGSKINLELNQFTVDNQTITLSFSTHDEQRIKRDAVLKNIEVLRSRLDTLGVGEILIAAQGERNIVIELPGVSNAQEARNKIGTAAVLEFKLVEKAGPSKDDILFEYDGELPSGMEIVNDDSYFYLVPRRAAVTGKYLHDASASRNERGKPVVAFEFSGEGADKFYELTSKNHGRTLAAILDGKVVTAAQISTSIRNSGIITGDFDIKRAESLASLLKSGSFVAPVKYEEERKVAPTLGAEAIEQGFVSCFVGLGLLLLFSLFFYSFCGLLAFITLLFNIVFMLFGLYLLDATLTLPGIGGIVLTVGMAIDASILIYERIREELAAGVAIRKAVSDGFSDAMRVILDSNITTFIVGLILYMFGSGPIKGFAVTLMLGIISTLITGLFLLRSMFNFMLNNFNIQKLRI